MVNFRQLVVGFLIVGIFMFSLISFGITLQTQNNSSQSLLDDSTFNDTFGDLQTEIQGSKVVADNQREAFESQEPGAGGFNFDLTSIIGAGIKFTDFLSSAGGMITIILTAPQVYLGIPGIVTIGIASLITITIILLAWRLYRTGE